MQSNLALLRSQMSQDRANQIAEQLQELIFAGEFVDGERLDENSLAEKFGVSRTPLREALKILGVSGIVKPIPNRGVFVCQPGPVELVEMFEVMSELEAFCGRLASKRITDQALEDLQAAHQQCKTAKESNDPDGYYVHNERFHQIIYQQSGNAFLAEEATRLQKRLQPFRRIQLRYRGRINQSFEEHEKIIQALLLGDTNMVESAIREHVAVQGDKFHQLIASLKVMNKEA